MSKLKYVLAASTSLAVTGTAYAAFAPNYQDLIRTANAALASFGIQHTASEGTVDHVGTTVQARLNTAYEMLFDPPSVHQNDPPDWSKPAARFTASELGVAVDIAQNDPPDWSTPSPYNDPPDWSKPAARFTTSVQGLGLDVYQNDPPDWSKPSPYNDPPDWSHPAAAQFRTSVQGLTLDLAANDPPDWSAPAPRHRLTANGGVIDLDVFAMDPPDWSRPSDAQVMTTPETIDLSIATWSPRNWELASPAKIEVHAGSAFMVKITGGDGRLIGTYLLTSKGQLKLMR